MLFQIQTISSIYHVKRSGSFCPKVNIKKPDELGGFIKAWALQIYGTIHRIVQENVLC